MENKRIEKEILWLLQKLEHESQLKGGEVEFSYIPAHYTEIPDIEQRKLLNRIRDLEVVVLGPGKGPFNGYSDWIEDHRSYSADDDPNEFINIKVKRKEFDELLKSLKEKYEKVTVKLEKEGTELQLVAGNNEPIILHDFAYDSWPDKLFDHLIVNGDETHSRKDLVASGSLPASGGQGVNTYVNKLLFYSALRKHFFPVCTATEIKMRKSVTVPFAVCQQILSKLPDKIL